MRKGSWTLVFMLVAILFSPISVLSAPDHSPGAKARCPVCGMFVAKYDQWIAQVRIEGQEPKFFDGVKDMMAYYFDAPSYGGQQVGADAEIWVRNYYTLAYIDGRKSFYVIGSDVLGPMGDELIPFSSRKEAENFKKDHHGTKILSFEQISPEMIREMKKKHMMKMKKKKQQ